MTELALTAPVDYLFELSVGMDALVTGRESAAAAALGGARKVLVIADGTAGSTLTLVRQLLDAEQRAGRLDSFTVRDAAGLAAGGELEAIEQIAHWALTAKLARRDVFLAVGTSETLHLAAVAASAFRRYTPCVRVLTSLSQIVGCLRSGAHVRQSGLSVGASPRRVSYLVDTAAVQVSAGDPAALLLAMLDPSLADRLAILPRSAWGRECAEAITEIGRRYGPGHEVWATGLPLVGDALGQLREGIERADRSGLCHNDRIAALRAVVTALGGDPAGTTSDELLVPADHGCAMLGTGGLRPLLAGACEEREQDPGQGRSPVLSHRSTIRKRMAVGISEDLWADTDTVHNTIAGGSSARRLLVAIDDFDPAYTARVVAALDGARSAGALGDFTVIFLEPTDRKKNHEQTRRLLDAAHQLQLTPDDQVVAIGGGTVLDITGYAVSLLSPPVPYIRIPTSLVGMIDAGVGLKVGVNLHGHKNLCGAYHPANLTVCDLRPLETLPVIEMRCGLVEAAKIAIVCDSYLFDLLDLHRPPLAEGRLATQPLIEVVSRSIRAMTDELGINPLEENLRRLPDFGHELGHLFEANTGYQLRHGEAVAIGLAISTCIAYAARRTSRRTRDRILSLMLDLGLELWHETCDPRVVYDHLRNEVVANKGGLMHLVIPTTIGRGGYIDSPGELTYAHVNSALHQVKTYCA